MNPLGRHFLVDIRVPENYPSGLISLSSDDPRKREDKPDVFVGLVTAVGPKCLWVKQGKKIAFQRFDYGSQSADIEEGFILAHEKDVLILGEDEAAPGVVAVNVLEEEEGVVIPDWVKANNEMPTLIGQVVASGWQCGWECKSRGFCTQEHVFPKEIIYFRRIPEQQFRLGEHMIIFNNLCRHCRDHVKMDCAADIILAKMEEVVIPRMVEVIS